VVVFKPGSYLFHKLHDDKDYRIAWILAAGSSQHNLHRNAVNLPPFVIPAKAGIQWFQPDLLRSYP
jgi:hypothetical protein